MTWSGGACVPNYATPNLKTDIEPAPYRVAKYLPFPNHPRTIPGVEGEQHNPSRRFFVLPILFPPFPGILSPLSVLR